VQKHWRKHGLPSPSQQAEAAAKVDGMIADLRAKAAELPALRAKTERLEDKLNEFIFRVAELAALINPKLFEESPATAVKLAVKRLRDTRRILGEIAQGEKLKEKQAVADAQRADLASVRVEYDEGVRLITGELKNWDRALDKFKRYVAARKLTKGSSVEKVLAHYRKHGFRGSELVNEKKEFMRWWKQERSGQAREAARARKRGKVKRPKSDLRFKENRRHKKGYCRVCGKRVRPRQRVCDDHIKGKPFLVHVGSNDLAKLDDDSSVVARY
jgi:hypothetical protein